MESKEKISFQVAHNHFNDAESEFVSHITLNTSAGTQRPFYPQISAIKNFNERIILGIKTGQSIICVYFKKNDFEEYKKINLDDSRMEKQILSYFTFQKPTFTTQNPPYIIAGFRSGLIGYIDCFRQKMVSIHNFDERTNLCVKSQMVTLIAPLPGNNSNEVLVVFNDSSVIRYSMDIRSESSAFADKLAKFETKISFTQAKNRFRHALKKSKKGFTLGSLISNEAPEFNNFYLINDPSSEQNPVSYYKFNQRTITDLVIKNDIRFKNTIMSQSKSKEPIIMAITSYDGYVIIFDYYKMDPLFSYKGNFGGFNSVTFSNNCEWIGLGGRDDCIYLINLLNHRKIKCEGHKSFVSKVIFHEIPRGKENEEESKSNSEYLRVISGGMDSCLGFWEFEKKSNLQNKEIKNFPIRLSEKNTTNEIISASHLEKTKDAIGWVDFVEELLVQCGFDGTVTTYLIKDIKKKKKGMSNNTQNNMEADNNEKQQEIDSVNPEGKTMEGFYKPPVQRDIKTSYGNRGEANPEEIRDNSRKENKQQNKAEEKDEEDQEQ